MITLTDVGTVSPTTRPPKQSLAFILLQGLTAESVRILGPHEICPIFPALYDGCTPARSDPTQTCVSLEWQCLPLPSPQQCTVWLLPGSLLSIPYYLVYHITQYTVLLTQYTMLLSIPYYLVYHITYLVYLSVYSPTELTFLDQPTLPTQGWKML